MTSARVHVDLDGDSVRVRTNLRALDPCLQADAFRALAAHMGWDPVPLEKAIHKHPSPEDPRYPELFALVRKAQRDWTRWGSWLVARVKDLMGHRSAAQPSDEVADQVEALLRRHRVGITFDVTGHVVGTADRAAHASNRREGLAATVSRVEQQFRVGLTRDPSVPHEREQRTWEDVVRAGSRVELNAREVEALGYVKRRAAVFMRRPIDTAHTNVRRTLSEAERDLVGGAIGRGLAQRLDTTAIEQDLAEALQGTTLTNNVARVVRTELAFGNGFAGYTLLKQRSEAAGIDDPQVYKQVHPMACVHCRRIWGPAGSPTIYRLSTIEARDAAGGNFGLPASQWGPSAGPIHPNCTEGSLQLYHAAIMERLRIVADTF